MAKMIPIHRASAWISIIPEAPSEAKASYFTTLLKKKSKNFVER